MRFPIIAASIAAILDISYRAYKGVGNDEITRSVIRDGVVVITLAIIGFYEPLASLSNTLLYTFVVVVLLSSGYEIMKGIATL